MLGGAKPAPYAVLDHEISSHSIHILILHDHQTNNFPPANRRESWKVSISTTGVQMRFITGIIALVLCSVLFLHLIRTSIPDVVDHDFGVAFDLTSPYG